MATAKVFTSVFPKPSRANGSEDGIRKRLLSDLRPAVAKALKHEDPYYALQGVVDILRQANVKDQAFITFGLPLAKIMDRLAELLKEYGRIILGIYDDSYFLLVEGEEEDPADPDFTRPRAYKTRYADSSTMQPGMDLDIVTSRDPPQNVQNAQRDLFRLLRGMQQAGLGGAEAQKALAKVMDVLLTEFIDWAYSGEYEKPSSDLFHHYSIWVENIFSKFAVQTLSIFKISDRSTHTPSPVQFEDVVNWENMATERVGKLRVKELFDIIVNWDSTASGIDDLKAYIANPATRSYVTGNFINILSQRLLMPGASTMEILQVYISIIRAFRRLDAKGVLLDRVARPVRHYLRTREDTVKIVVEGILAEVDQDDEGNPVASDSNILSELSVELKLRGLSENDNDNELDWNNMEWTPDPIDAAPDYKKSKTADVVGSLISLFDSKDVFVKELQIALADRLLQNKDEYDHEISVLEHLKLRFGDAALQACEVMLRDVLDSRRTDVVIRNDSRITPSRDMENDNGAHSVPLSNEKNIQIHTKILSRLFWPTQTLEPPDDPDSYDDAGAFVVPKPIEKLQQTFEHGFEELKQSRKLTWLNNLGHVTVELDLEDRIFKADDITPMQASVIYAFQDTVDQATVEPVTKTVDELSAALKLPAFFVRQCCSFWVTKQILAATPSTSPGSSYTVLERLPKDAPPSAPASASKSVPPPSTTQLPTSAEVPSSLQPDPATPVRSRSAIPPAKAALYNQFIVSMLTNQGAMPLARIGMMLGIVVPGGWGYGNEELRELLVDLQREGKVEMGNGGVWKIAQD